MRDQKQQLLWILVTGFLLTSCSSNNPGGNGMGDSRIDIPIDGCFASGTRVITPSGPIAIEELRVGQRVYSYDESRQMVTESLVERLIEHPNRPFQRLRLPTGELVGVTAEHPIYVLGSKAAVGDYVDAGRLLIGQRVLLLAGLSGAVPQVLSMTLMETLQMSQEQGPVYDLTVSPRHNFFVEGMLVHNKSPAIDMNPQDLSTTTDMTARGGVGAPCTADAQCETGVCLKETEDRQFVGGYCTIKGCSDTMGQVCPTGSECRGTALGMPICLRVCLGMMDVCRKEYRCCGPGPAPRWCAPPQSQVCMLR